MEVVVEVAHINLRLSRLDGLLRCTTAPVLRSQSRAASGARMRAALNAPQRGLLKSIASRSNLATMQRGVKPFYVHVSGLL